ncbi:enoyl-CoA hydratase-related protein [Ilumatobacter sp.]|uniref:enoyl-CoA hydratase-related protein n=1 Tax=Ilumatobacter sp. TaxID=1967498 RepID=UPI003C4B309F
MELKATRFDVTDRIATLWLDRPHRSNAWTGRMHSEYRWIMSELEDRDDVRAVIVTGTGDRFCVGGDSDALSAHAESGSYDTGVTDREAQPGGGDRLDADFAWQLGYRHPIIAAVNGACAGIGLALVLFCDLRFVRHGAKLTTAAPKLGLPAEYGMTWTLPRLVGTTRAADLLLSGRVFTGDESAEWGLWNGVGDDPLSAATAWARTLATTTGPTAVATTKQQLAADLLRHDPAASVADSKRLMDVAMATAEYAEGVAALVEKRPPRFDDQTTP